MKIFFSDREKQCIQLLCEAASTTLIEQALNIHSTTASYYLNNIKVKLGYSLKEKIKIKNQNKSDFKEE